MAAEMPIPKIYLAGPDVFRVDARGHFEMLALCCETHGLQALVPIDNSDSSDGDDSDRASTIYARNMQLLRSASGVIANLCPFRGPEPDSGTVFELAVAVERGLPVVAYGLPCEPYSTRIPDCARDSSGILRDKSGMAVEEFGLPVNLMLAKAVRIAPSARDAIAEIARVLARAS